MSVLLGPNFEIETAELLTRMRQVSVLPSYALRSLINLTIRNLKSTGCWSKIDVLKFYCLHRQEAALLNWKGDYCNSTNVNSVPWTAKSGYTNNANTQYINSNFNPSTTGITWNYQLNDAFFGAHIISDYYTATQAIIAGATTDYTYMVPRYWSGGSNYPCRGCINGQSLITGFLRNDSLGMLIYERKNNTQHRIILNGNAATQTAAVGSLPNSTFKECGSTTAFYGGTIACTVYGGGFTSQNHLDFYDIIKYFVDHINDVLYAPVETPIALLIAPGDTSNVLTWSDANYGISQTEIYCSIDGGEYSLVGTADTGLVSYTHTIDMYTYTLCSYKIRAKNGDFYSNFTDYVTIIMGSNLVANGGDLTTTTDWLNPDSSGIASGFTWAGVDSLSSIVTGNGFVGNAQRTTSNSYIYLVSSVIMSAGTYYHSIKERNNTSVGSYYYANASVQINTLPRNIGDAIYKRFVYTTSAGYATPIRIYTYGGVGAYTEVDEWIIKRITTIQTNYSPSQIPQIQSITINNSAPTQITITYDTLLDESSTPSTTAYSISGNNVNTVIVLSSSVILNVANRYYSGDTINVSYTAPLVNPIKTAFFGITGHSFTDQTVTNNITL